MYPAQPPYPPPPPPRRRTNPALIVLAVVAGVILLCCGGGCVSAVIGASDDDSSTTESTTTRATTTRYAAPAPPPTTASPPATGGLTDQDINDMAFMMSMDKQGIHYSSRAAIIDLGHAVCAGLGEGGSETEISLVIADKGYPLEDAGYIVGAAISSYCPQHR